MSGKVAKELWTSCCWVAIDLLLCVAILEGTTFEGETSYALQALLTCIAMLLFPVSQSFLPMLFFVVAVLGVVGTWCYPTDSVGQISAIGAACLVWAGRRATVASAPINPLFIVVAAVCTFFYQGVAVHEWLYCRLSGAPCTSIGFTEILSVLALLSLAVASYRSRYRFGIEGMHSRVFSSTALLISVVFGASASIHHNAHFTFTLPESFVLPLTFVLFIVRALGRSSPEFSVVSRAVVVTRSTVATLPLLIVTGSLLYSAYTTDDRTARASSQRYPIPRTVLLPLLVSEDPTFMEHHGVDWVRLKDALRERIERGRYGRGGSTLSMQLAKVEYLTYEKTLLRKLNQISLGIIFEVLYSKEEILFAYVNEVPFAPGVIGLTAASKAFYDKTPVELSREEGLNLVLTMFDPTEYSPQSTNIPTSVVHRALTISARVAAFRAELERGLIKAPAIGGFVLIDRTQ